MLEHLSADIFCSSKLCSLLGTNNVHDQISEHIFLLNGGYCVYHPSDIFRSKHGFENW